MICLRDDPTRGLTHDELVAQAAQYLEYRGWLVVVTHDHRHRPLTPGITDLIAMRRNGNVLLEAKIGRDVLRPEQIEFRDRAIRRGVDVHEFRSLEELEAIAHRL